MKKRTPPRYTILVRLHCIDGGVSSWDFASVMEGQLLVPLDRLRNDEEFKPFLNPYNFWASRCRGVATSALEYCVFPERSRIVKALLATHTEK